MSRRTAISRPNGAGSSFGYDLASRLTSLMQDVSGTTNELSHTFTCNLASQLGTRANATATHACLLPVTSRAYTTNGLNQYALLRLRARGSGAVPGELGRHLVMYSLLAVMNAAFSMMSGIVGFVLDIQKRRDADSIIKKKNLGRSHARSFLREDQERSGSRTDA